MRSPRVPHEREFIYFIFFLPIDIFFLRMQDAKSCIRQKVTIVVLEN